VKHTIATLVINKPGVLARVAGLFARRGYNVQSLSVNITRDAKFADPSGERFSRMTIVVDDEGNPRIMEQIEKQLYKLVDVVKVSDHTRTNIVPRELALVKVRAPAAKRAELLSLCTIFRADIADVGEETVIVQAVGTPDKLDALVSLLEDYGVLELVRTGRVVLVRGAEAT